MLPTRGFAISAQRCLLNSARRIQIWHPINFQVFATSFHRRYFRQARETS